MARQLIQEFGITPTGIAPETWPWPVKVYTLGKFALLVDDAPPAFSRKAPKKIIALLKALIACGGEGVTEQQLVDALWPDEEGDTAHRLLAVTLHRLRKLLRHGDVIRQSGKALSLHPSRCWVDAWAFERLVGDDAGSAERETGASVLERASSLYRGAFLAQDDDAPWAVRMRERLRAKFVRTVAGHGALLEAAGHYEDAVTCYLGGLQADDLVEPFYQGLMRCYDKLNRRTEAMNAYRRLRQTLSVCLGVQPSAATERLYQTLRAA